MVDDLDAIRRELAEIVDLLSATPGDDFATRHALMKRRDELRAAADRHRTDHDEQRPTEDLQAELAAREAQLEALVGEAMDMVTQAGGSGGGGTGAGYVSAGEAGINVAMRDAGGAPQIRERIARLRQILESRSRNG